MYFAHCQLYQLLVKPSSITKQILCTGFAIMGKHGREVKLFLLSSIYFETNIFVSMSLQLCDPCTIVLHVTPSVIRFKSFRRETCFGRFSTYEKVGKDGLQYCHFMSRVSVRISMNQGGKSEKHAFLNIYQYCNNISYYFTCSHIQ